MGPSRSSWSGEDEHTEVTLLWRVSVQRGGVHGVLWTAGVASFLRGGGRLLGGASWEPNTSPGKGLAQAKGWKSKGVWLAGGGCTSADGAAGRELRLKQPMEQPHRRPGSAGQRFCGADEAPLKAFK